MSESRKSTVIRGRRSPTAVWIKRYSGKRGTNYRVRWIDPLTGKEKTESCGHDYALARIKRDEKKAELREGLSGRLPDKTLYDLKEALSEFMAGKSPHTVRKTRGSLDGLIDLCGDRLLTRVDRGFLMDFRAKRSESVKPATVNKDLRQIKSALSYAVDAGWIRTNPMWRWKNLQLKEPEKRVRVLEFQEFKALLEACPNPTFRALMVVGYRQGLRRSELANLRWSAVDLDKGVLHVENVVAAGELTKSRKHRAAPLHPDAKKALNTLWESVPKVVAGGKQRAKYPHCFTWDDGAPYRADWLTHEFARVQKRAGIEPCTLHDLRRSFSTLAQRAGVDKATVKDLGGWSSIGVVEKHYTGEVSEVFTRAMDRIVSAEEKIG